MLECLIIGDSIAVGIGMNRPECATIAKVGITSQNWLHSYQNHPTFNRPYKIAVISLGTNDYRNTTAENIYDIRLKTKADMVIWILPSATLKPIQRVIIKEIANEFHDRTMDITQFIGPDGIHPHGKGYQDIAKQTLPK
jgi:lysophospholipase L1-like esterase